MSNSNYARGYDRIYHKPRKRVKKEVKPKHLKRSVAGNMSFDTLFGIRWEQLRFSNSREHVTPDIKKMVSNFADWQKNGTTKYRCQ